MPTDKQLQDRKNHIGASDMPAILGLNEYKTAYDVWLEKTGKVEMNKSTIETQIGQSLESTVLDIAEKELGKMERDPEKLEVKADGGLNIVSHLDARLLEPGRPPVEAKTHAVLNTFSHEHWGESNSDDVPDRIIIQCSTQLLCTGSEICFIPALIGGRGYCLFTVHRDQALINMIADAAIEFWNNVVKDIPPEDSLPTIKYVKSIIRQPKSVIDLTGSEEYVSKWLYAKEVAKMTEKAAQDAERKMLSLLGTNESAKFSNGNLMYLEVFNKGGTRTVAPYSYRVPRFKKKELTDGK
jgi:putative phage-type endonuclease